MIHMIIVTGIIILLALTVFATRSMTEGFADSKLLQQQRQQLQFEGERRYNDLARIQDPNSKISIEQADAAFGGEQPVPSSASSSLLNLLGAAAGVMPQDDGSNKQGSGVEQTGTVQDKINFCESLKTVDCNMLKDPRMSECGFCHRDGKSSSGVAHRGGMFISADDQIRANEVGKASGMPAVYKPTIGTCKPQNFTLMEDRCDAREKSLMCERAGAPTSANECGQCFGGAAPGTSGILYVGPKPKYFFAFLHMSNPGLHKGAVITTPDQNQTMNLPTSNNPGLNHVSTIISLREGATLNIKIYGMPRFWCGWLTSLDGKRSIPLDIGITNRDTLPLMVAGSKNSSAVKRFFANEPKFSKFLEEVPNTVLWYQRQPNVLPPSVVSARVEEYDFTDKIKEAASQNQDFVVPFVSRTSALHLPCIVTFDNGTSIAVRQQHYGEQHPDSVLKKEKIYSLVSMDITIPATLADPYYEEDNDLCPTGAMIHTEIGAGIMGSNSCFKPDGSFNPSVFCLQELFRAAGGSQQGNGWPATADKIPALLRPSAAAPTLDDTVAYLNNMGQIASYGVDSAGKVVDFAMFRSACQLMLGFVPMNPCEGPTKTNGPHSAACLDYLWKTSGNPAADNSHADPSTWPYEYCGAGGAAAPLNPDGSVNENNVAAANAQGGISSVRHWFNSFFQGARDTSDFNNQAAAVRNCFGIKMETPKTNPTDCPAPNPDEWQAFPIGVNIRPGDVLSLASAGSPDKYMLVTGSRQQWTTRPLSENANNANNASIQIMKALNGKPDYISFASSYGEYLRHAGFVAQSGMPDGSALFNEDASFRVVAGLDGNNKHVSFQSSNYPTRYLARREDNVLVLAQDPLPQNASWIGGMAQNGMLSEADENGNRKRFNNESSYWLVREQNPRLGDKGRNTQCITNDQRTKCVVYTSEKEARKAAAALPPNPPTGDLSARDGSGWTTPWASAIDNFLRVRV